MTIAVTPDYYEDTTEPIFSERRLRTARSWHLEEVTIAVQPPAVGRGHPVHLHLVRAQLHRLRRGRRHVRRADGRGRRRGRRAHGGAHPPARRRPRRDELLAFVLIFVGVLSSVATDAGYLILVPLGAAAFASVGRHPLAGLAAVLRGRGRDLRGQPDPGPGRRADHRDHQRGAGRHGRPTADHRLQLVLQHRLVDRARHRRRAIVTERIVETRLGPWKRRRRPHGRGRRRPHASTRERRPRRRACASALFAFLGFLGYRARASPCRPARRCATRRPATSSATRRSWTA